MNILYFAPIAFGYLKQRPQYIAEALAKFHTVFYIEPTVSLTAAVHNKEKKLDYKQRRCKRSEKLYVIKLDGRFSLPYRLKYADPLGIAAVSEYIQLVCSVKKIDLIWIGYPGWYDVAKYFQDVCMVYDIMDDYAKLAGDRKTGIYLRRCSKKLETEADIMITSSVLFYENMRRKRKNVFLIPNALPDVYGQKLKPEDMEPKEVRLTQAIFGYTGVIAEWFDTAIIAELAGLEDSRVVLAGPVSISKLQKENITYTGQVPKAAVLNIIQKCDVCLYPFLPGPLLDTINPVKIYEYLALNKPVIARRSRETEQFAGLISLYADMEEFRQILKKGVKQPFFNWKSYRSFVEKNSWGYRGRQIEKILSRLAVVSCDIPQQKAYVRLWKVLQKFWRKIR